MNENTSTQDFATAEAALRSAGITYTVVAGCRDGSCRWCDAASLPTAA